MNPTASSDNLQGKVSAQPSPYTNNPSYQRTSSHNSATYMNNSPGPHPQPMMPMQMNGPMNCAACCTATPTITRLKPGKVTYICCLALLFIGCCCIPFCVDSLQDTEMVCGSCGQLKMRT